MCKRGGTAIYATGCVVRVITNLTPSAVKLRAEAISIWDVEALFARDFPKVIERSVIVVVW